MNYKERIADKMLAERLARKGAVLIEGPKWCGKTTTAKQIARSVLDLGDGLVLEQSRQMMSVSPYTLLSGSTPRLIDEWQTIPSLWDIIRSEVDRRGLPGQFIFTGSSVPPDIKSFTHSGTGRYVRLKMRPMSLFESKESTGQVSISNLFDNPDIGVINVSNAIEQVAYQICRGGLPQAVSLSGDAALEQAFDYIEDISNVDIHRVDDVRRSTLTTRHLLRSLARHQGTSVSYAAICADIKNNDKQSTTDETVASYVDALNKIFVIEDMEAWNPNLRSSTAIRTSSTRYFIDPSFATAALGLSPKDLINDLKTMGFMFETMAVRDLRVYADALNGKVYHYRDGNGLECDSVIHLRNGKYGLVEIKLGGVDAIELAANNLKKLSDKIDTDRMYAPSFMMVLIAVGPYAYRRPDGVYVVPINALK
ncbi:MAG TPA: AAA family ATPase [Bacteroidales bacterium]|nr:AAA family ATPase [Bacteroidales bacterium]